MIMVYKLIAQAARTDATVLILGESGTGKELVARAIHDFSSRANRPFLTVNCSGLTDTLLESELFGHTRGAFTGAAGDRAGLFEAADGGTLFLDELASTSPAFQASLLRVLQSGEVRRVGSTQSRRFNVRVIGASNAPLRDLVAAGSFRSDLFYRLNVFRIELPPLRERRDDVPALVNHFVGKFSLAMNKRITRVAAGAMNLLQQQQWTGNVRELENAVERAMVVAQEPEVREQDFIFKSLVPNGAPKTLEDIEKAHILRTLERCGWNQTRAAEVLDIDRVTLHHKIKRYGWSKQTVGSR